MNTQKDLEPGGGWVFAMQKPWVEIQDGIWCPSQIDLSLKGSVTDAQGEEIESPYDLEIVLRPQNGSMIVAAMTAAQRPGGDPVTVDGLRAIPLTSYRDAGSWGTYLHHDKPGRLAPEKLRRVPITYPEFGIRAAKYGPNDEALEALALIYKVAVIIGRPPTREVSNKLGLTRPTAGRWVMKARTMGLLPAVEEKI